MAGNTAPIHGKVARVEKNSTNMDFTEGWTIDVALDMADTSRQGQDWKEGIPGQAGWSGSFSGQLVEGNTEQAAIMTNIVTATPGTKLTDMEFVLEDSGDYYSGNLFITGVTINAPVGDKVTFNVTFQGDSTLSRTVA